MTKIKNSLSAGAGAYLGVNITCRGLQLGEEVGLTQRKHSVFSIGVELYYHVLDLWAGVGGHGRNVSSREYLVSPQKFIPEPVL